MPICRSCSFLALLLFGTIGFVSESRAALITLNPVAQAAWGAFVDDTGDFYSYHSHDSFYGGNPLNLLEVGGDEVQPGVANEPIRAAVEFFVPFIDARITSATFTIRLGAEGLAEDRLRSRVTTYENIIDVRAYEGDGSADPANDFDPSGFASVGPLVVPIGSTGADIATSNGELTLFEDGDLFSIDVLDAIKNYPALGSQFLGFMLDSIIHFDVLTKGHSFYNPQLIIEVPEPSTMLLFVFNILAIFLVRRRSFNL